MQVMRVHHASEVAFVAMRFALRCRDLKMDGLQCAQIVDREANGENVLQSVLHDLLQGGLAAPSRLPLLLVDPWSYSRAVDSSIAAMATTQVAPPTADEVEKKEEELFRTGPLSVLTTSVKSNSQVRWARGPARAPLLRAAGGPCAAGGMCR